MKSENEISEILRYGDKFLIVTHVNPDGDAVGSLLGMYLALKEMGKAAWALSAGAFPHNYDFLPGFSDVMTEPEKLPREIDWIISLDVAEPNRIAGNTDQFRPLAKLVNIDHHGTNPRFGDIHYVVPEATSTAELVWTILKTAGYKLSTNVAKCLYTGVVTDTGCFRFPGVDHRTLSIGAELLASGFQSYDVTRYLYEEFPPARLQIEKLILDRLEILLDGRLLISTLYYSDFNALEMRMSDAENLVNKLRDNKGVRAGVLLTVMEDDLIRVSFRSKDLDVAEIAASLGGGGHYHAAGLKSRLPLADLKTQIIDKIGAAL